MPRDEQRHEPLALLSGEFTGRWAYLTTSNKVAYVVVKTFRKPANPLACEAHTHSFTDQKNVLLVFNLLPIEPALGRHEVLKVNMMGIVSERLFISLSTS